MTMEMDDRCLSLTETITPKAVKQIDD